MNIKLLQDTPPWDWPENAGKIFKKTLLDPRASESDRVAAAELAGSIVAIDDDLAAALLTTISNDADPVALRAQAAISLGPALEQGSITEFDDPEDVPISKEMFDRIQDTLQKLYADEAFPKEVRRRIFEASVRDPRDWHNDAILAAYNSGDPEWMLTAVFAMGYVRGFETQILEALKSPDPLIHFEAVDAAGTWEIDAAYDHVLSLVNDPATPKPLIFAAIEAVAGIRPKDAGQALLDRMDDADEEIEEAANDAVAMASGADDTWDEDDEEEPEGKDWVN
ncbi:MAG: hypothetical protein JWP63_374 [Candidatus Solibacter sp.]|jgi:hypothetical protein|nr:hypothetical protein [Candidatus Solibacter sp.]